MPLEWNNNDPQGLLYRLARRAVRFHMIISKFQGRSQESLLAEDYEISEEDAILRGKTQRPQRQKGYKESNEAKMALSPPVSFLVSQEGHL